MTLKSMHIVIWGQRSFWLYVLSQMTSLIGMSLKGVFASLAIVDTDFAQGSSHYAALAIVDTDFAQGSSHYAALDQQRFSPWPATTAFCLLSKTHYSQSIAHRSPCMCLTNGQIQG